MNRLPPNQEPPFDVDDWYRRASALDPTRPGGDVRRVVLEHAARLAAERHSRAQQAAAAGTPRRTRFTGTRFALFGSLAAAALAAVMILPRWLAVRAPRSEAPALAPTQAIAPQALTQSVAEPKPPAQADSEDTHERLSPHSDRARARARAGNRPAAPLASAAPVPALVPPAELALPAPAAPQVSPGPQAAVAKLSSAARADRSVQGGAVQDVVVTGARGTAASAAALAAAATPVASDSERLWRAAEAGDLATLRQILQGNADIDARDSLGRTALMLATLQGQRDAVGLLLERGADPNAADSAGTTPLQAARAGKQAAILSALQQHGAR
jgi:ankyrin repeat protein